MHRPASLSLIIGGGAFLVVGCGGAGGPAQVTGPTGFDGASAALSVTAPTVSSRTTSNPDCRGSAPFTIALNLSVQPRGHANMRVTRIRMRLDGVEETQDALTMPQVTLAAPVPIVQFGSALSEARDDQTFALSFPVGCRAPRHGTLVVVVDTRDGQGRQWSGQISVPVG